MLRGIGVSEGIGLGRVMLLEESSLIYEEKRDIDAAAEKARLLQAVDTFCANTAGQMELLKASAGQKDACILESHINIVRDPELQEQVGQLIDQGKCAEFAIKEKCDQYVEMFTSSNDELTRLRASDIRDVCNALLCLLLGVKETEVHQAPKGTILVAKELSPSVMAAIDKERIAGLVTEAGGRMSHFSILARAMGVPTVCGIEGAAAKLWNGEFVIVDGSRGEVICEPGQEQIQEYMKKQTDFLEEYVPQSFRDKRTLSASGEEYHLYCNISMPTGAARAVEAGGEGVGLFRTEYLFMNREQAPGEEEQYRAYCQALQGLESRPLVARTLDVGGDKVVPCLSMGEEENPFLGLRGIRWCMAHQEVFLVQLRALLRAGTQGDLRIMLPMISSLEELRAGRALLQEAGEQLKAQGVRYAQNLPVGIMIETPAAVFLAEELAQEADFFSIGTNDLTGYIMACDRGNPAVGHLYSPLQPAVLKGLRHVIQCGVHRGIPVSVCGEAASDQRLIPLLMAFGLSGFSVPVASVLAVRRLISRWTREEAEAIAEKAMKMNTEAEIAETLTK